MVSLSGHLSATFNGEMLLDSFSSRDRQKEQVVTADKPSEVTLDLQIAQAPGNGGWREKMKRTEEEHLHKLLMEQR